MSGADVWQFAIGVLVLLDALYLVRKFSRTRNNNLLVAIMPRLYLAFVYVFDGIVPRTAMEPMNTIKFFGLALFFMTANINHFAEWRHHK